MEPVLLQSLPARTSDIVVLEDRRGGEHRQSETSAQSLPPPGAVRSHSRRAPFSRGQSQVQMALNGSANFFGWNDSEGEIRRSWGSKRLRFLAKKYNLNHHRALTEARSLDPTLSYNYTDHPVDTSSSRDGNQTRSRALSQYDPNSPFTAFHHHAVSPCTCDITTPASVVRSISQASEACSRLRPERRESAARLAYGAAANLAKRGFVNPQRMHRVRLSSRPVLRFGFLGI
ncbi:hypothetical protein KIN20_016036 [Parelaphostrongylus tenuis]|uniref:Uncharacterized protein n=1 Tax=Parelaphostrongylus tenuis TaxID=148309 RepID=A0AAD5MY28_PARTN|nr:hypothetical protein KIN20_016036 [Parelaphostrongylus tenuis]